MQLRQAKSFGTFDDHHRGIGDINAHLNDRGRYHDLCLSRDKTLHFVVFVGWFHLPMYDADAVIGEGESAHQAFIAVHQVFIIHFFRLLDERIHDIYLPALGDFFFEKLKHV